MVAEASRGVETRARKRKRDLAAQVGVAIVPALIITVLFFFDHNVSAQLAQTEDFGLKKPPAYHYDFMLQGVNTLLLGLLGLPPTNGVLPQAPMHTRSLMGVGRDRADKDASSVVLEQRVSNFIQSSLIAVMLFASPVVKLLPRAVLWGYFIFMAIESFPGNQFIHRVTLFVTDLTSFRAGETQPAYVELVPKEDTYKFTVVQLLALGSVYAVTWAGVYGIAFPLLIMALVPVKRAAWRTTRPWLRGLLLEATGLVDHMLVPLLIQNTALRLTWEAFGRGNFLFGRAVIKQGLGLKLKKGQLIKKRPIVSAGLFKRRDRRRGRRALDQFGGR